MYNYIKLHTKLHIHAPQEKLELIGCYLLRKAGFGEQGFDFQFYDNQNLGQSFEKCEIYTKNPKISHCLFWNFCGIKSLGW